MDSGKLKRLADRLNHLECLRIQFTLLPSWQDISSQMYTLRLNTEFTGRGMSDDFRKEMERLAKHLSTALTDFYTPEINRLHESIQEISCPKNTTSD